MRKKTGILTVTFAGLLLANFYLAQQFQVQAVWPAVLIHGYFFIFGWISMKILDSPKAAGKRFVTYFMGLTAAKLFLSLIILVVILLAQKEYKIFWAASFGAAYLTSLIQEVAFNLKKKS